MREILFRGKDHYDNEWVEGSLFTVTLDTYSELEKKTLTHCIAEPNVEMYRGEIGGFAFVIPETIGQYTGLTDKNGNKIFEGDIVKWDGEEISQIRYCNGVYRLCNAKGYYDIALHNHYSYVEVIGNIHDNPELLKGE